MIRDGHARVFLGSDSAPHPMALKDAFNLNSLIMAKDEKDTEDLFDLKPTVAAGIYTFPHLLPLLATIFEKECLTAMQFKKFVCENGAKFMDWPLSTTVKYKLTKAVPYKVPLVYRDGNNERMMVVPFMAGKTLPWSIIPLVGNQ